MNTPELLEAMLRIPSLSGRERELAGFLVAVMRDLGLQAWIDAAGNALGCRDGGGPIRREIMLLGHMDTVPGEIPVRVESGQLFGRGAVDAKGPLAAFIVAAARAELPSDTRVIVAGAVEEESASSRGAHHIAGTFHPTHCLIGEPSGWETSTLGYKGRLLIDYDLVQPCGHSAGEAPSAPERAIEFWNAVRCLAERSSAETSGHWSRLLPSLRQIESSSDGLHERVEMRLGLRLPPETDVADLREELTRVATGARLRFHAHVPAVRSPRGTPLGRALDRAIREEGGRPRHVVKSGTSDMNVVGPAWGCPILAYGPGDSRLDHTPDEHVEIAELERATRVLQHLLASDTW